MSRPMAPSGTLEARLRTLIESQRQATRTGSLPILKGITNAPAVGPADEQRWRSRKERANELRERMAVFAPIYNAAWLVRDAYFGPDERRQLCVKALLATMAEQMRATDDFEAC